MMFCGIDKISRKQKKINKIINEQIKTCKEDARKEQKLLLLGTGESGKSTFLKQMRIIHENDYFEKERDDYKPYVYNNIIIAIQAIIKAMIKLNIQYSNPKNVGNALFLSDIYVDYNTKSLNQLSEELVNAIKELWSDFGVQKCYQRRNEYQLSDSAKYYFDCIDRLSAPDYVPTIDDILRVRIPTSGINEYTFKLSAVRLRVIDVGGQRSERRKWIHCFENVNSVIFLAALNEYDQILFESDQSLEGNQMEESLRLFNIIVDCNFLRNSSLILFLNKKDLFEDKIQSSHLVDYFPEYDGPKNDKLIGQEFILKMYLKIENICRRDSNRHSYKDIVYSHYTCAIDTENIKFVFESVRHIILGENLFRCQVGLY